MNEERTPKDRSKLLAQSREWGRIFIDVELVRNMYGDEVAIYFEWMQHFMRHLLWPGIFAIIVFFANQTLYTFDSSPLSALFSVSMTFWGVFFNVNWARHQRGLNITWGVYATKANEEQNMRKEFRGTEQISKVTDRPDQHFSFNERLPRYLVSFAICLPCLFSCMCIIVCFLNLTGVIRPEHHGGFFDIPWMSAMANEGAIFDPNGNMNMVISVVQAIVTVLINLQFRKVAAWTADFENHKS